MLMSGEYFHVTNEHHRQCLIDLLTKKDIPAHGFYAQIRDGAPKRTQLQNAFLWGWIYSQIAQQLEEGGIEIQLENGSTQPYTKDILHELFKRRFLKRGEITNEHGRTLELYGSTTDLSRGEFSDYITRVKHFVYGLWRIDVAEPERGIWHSYWQSIQNEVE